MTLSVLCNPACITDNWEASSKSVEFSASLKVARTACTSESAGDSVMEGEERAQDREDDAIDKKTTARWNEGVNVDT